MDGADNMSHGLCMFDKDQRLVTCNNAYAEIYRLPHDLTRVGMPLSQIFAYREHNGTLPIGGIAALEAKRKALASGTYPAESVIELETRKNSRALDAVVIH